MRNPSQTCTLIWTAREQLSRFSSSAFTNSSAVAAPGVTLEGTTDAYLTKNTFDLFSLRDQVTVITGGARGIGLALAFAVAEAGGRLAILDAAEQPHEHFEQLKKITKQVQYYKSDVTKFDVLEKSFDQISSDFGRIDGL